MIETRLEQLEKALDFNVRRFEGRITSVRELQWRNADSPMIVTPSGIEMETNPLQLWKEAVPKLVVVWGRVIVFKEEH